MRVKAYCILHYGKDYLAEAIQAVATQVEEINILYTSNPSHGHKTNVSCPESKEELKTIALNASKKVKWYEGNWSNEGQHRSAAIRACGTCDVIVVFDSDEVWDEQSLKQSIEIAAKSNVRNIGVKGFINYWRNFNYACFDGFAPIRLINTKHRKGQHNITGKVHHFSCAQSKAIMDCKYLIHGHKSELRKNWLHEIYYKWKPGVEDLHPVVFGLWKAEPVDKSTMPTILKNHKHYNLESF